MSSTHTVVPKKKLFMVRNIHNKKFVSLLFERKPAAKAYRDKLNEGKYKGWVVTYGPDHWRYT